MIFRRRRILARYPILFFLVWCFAVASFPMGPRIKRPRNPKGKDPKRKGQPPTGKRAESRVSRSKGKIRRGARTAKGVGPMTIFSSSHAAEYNFNTPSRESTVMDRQYDCGIARYLQRDRACSDQGIFVLALLTYAPRNELCLYQYPQCSSQGYSQKYPIVPQGNTAS